MRESIKDMPIMPFSELKAGDVVGVSNCKLSAHGTIAKVNRVTFLLQSKSRFSPTGPWFTAEYKLRHAELVGGSCLREGVVYQIT
jgi:hypothetical protein